MDDAMKEFQTDTAGGIEYGLADTPMVEEMRIQRAPDVITSSPHPGDLSSPHEMFVLTHDNISHHTENGNVDLHSKS